MRREGYQLVDDYLRHTRLDGMGMRETYAENLSRFELGQTSSTCESQIAISCDASCGIKEVTSMETEKGKIINGVDLSKMQAMREAIIKQPKSAWSKFLAKATWKTAFYNESTIDEFWLGGNKRSRARPFEIPADHPPDLLGMDKGALPPEILLAALANCITNNFASYGAGMGITIDSLVTLVEGDIDLQGTMGLPRPGKVRAGYQELRATYYIKSNATTEQLEKLAKISEDLSPTKDSLRAVKFSSKVVRQ